VPKHHEIKPLSIVGYDQQNLEKNLSDFKRVGHRLAQVFADGCSTASHKRKMMLSGVKAFLFLGHFFF